MCIQCGGRKTSTRRRILQGFTQGSAAPPWITRIRSIAEHSKKVFVVTNNHFQGKGVVNALQIISILKGSKVKVPDDLRTHFPELEGISNEMPAAPTLFPRGEPAAKKAKPA
jgi:hypothetical protein